MASSPPPFNNPFAKLAPKREELPAGRSPAPASEQRGPARAVVRLERKGRGGKEVTVIERLELPKAQLESWLKALKQAMGCGGAVDGASLVLQGDQRERVKALLAERGVGRISVG